MHYLCMEFKVVCIFELLKTLSALSLSSESSFVVVVLLVFSNRVKGGWGERAGGVELYIVLFEERNKLTVYFVKDYLRVLH